MVICLGHVDMKIWVYGEIKFELLYLFNTKAVHTRWTLSEN